MAATIASRTYEEDANQEKLSAAGRIPQHAFMTSIEVFFSLAALSVIGRMITRIYTRRRLDLDDGFLLFALLCLSACTGLVYVSCQKIFVIEAIQVDPTFNLPPDPYQVSFAMRWTLHSFTCIIWTTVFAVKFSFLALFRLLIRRLPKAITTYYWTTVGITVATWMFFLSEPFILCSYFDLAIIPKHCAPQTSYRLSTIIIIFVTFLDVITDIMIVSIPIIVLRKTQMKSAQKVGLSVLMGLSTVMAIVALVRASGSNIRGANQRKVYDLTWQIYWTYMEGCIACIMGSVVTFCSLFIVNHAGPHNQDAQRPSYSMWQRHLQTPRNSRFKRCLDPTSDEEDQLPVIPPATVSSARRFIRGTDEQIETSAKLSVICHRGDEKTPGPIDENHIYISNELNVTSQRVSLER